MNIKTQLRRRLMGFTMFIRLIFEAGLSQGLGSKNSRQQGRWKQGAPMATRETRYGVPVSLGVNLD